MVTQVPSVSRGSAAGFTLVELMMAMFILTVGLLGVASVMAGVISRQIRTASRMEMTVMAESKLEELRAYSMLGASDTMQVAIGGSLTSSVAIHADVQTSPSGRQFNRRWLVAAGPAGARNVTVRIEPVTSAGSTLPHLDFDAVLMVIR